MTDPREARSAEPPARSGEADAARRRTQVRVAVVVGGLLLGTAVVAGAVGPDRTDEPVGGAGSTPRATAVAEAAPGPTPAAGPTTGPTPTPAPAPPDAGAPAPAPAPPPDAAPAAPPVPPPTSPTLPPQAARITHGSQVWAVYVAVMESTGDPRWAQAGASLESLGYTASGGELACDVGSAEALGLDPQTLARGTYFDTEADAALFADLYDGEVVGTARVTLACLD